MNKIYQVIEWGLDKTYDFDTYKEAIKYFNKVKEKGAYHLHETIEDNNGEFTEHCLIQPKDWF